MIFRAKEHINQCLAHRGHSIRMDSIPINSGRLLMDQTWDFNQICKAKIKTKMQLILP